MNALISTTFIILLIGYRTCFYWTWGQSRYCGKGKESDICFLTILVMETKLSSSSPWKQCSFFETILQEKKIDKIWWVTIIYPYHKWRHVEEKSPRIIECKSMHESMQIGLKVVDNVVPIAHGQRKLIIKDRQTSAKKVLYFYWLFKFWFIYLCVLWPFFF